jgi:hypothetical protein
MAKMLFIQLHGLDGETVEGAASIYSDGKELPDGQLSVRETKSDSNVVMSIKDMPQHWRDEIKRWGLWADENLPCSEATD